MNSYYFDHYRVLLGELARHADPAGCAANSFLDFHRKGMEYLNLLRSPELTVKVYFFDPVGSGMRTGELLVNPHSHMYDFDTLVLRGLVRNVEFEPAWEGSRDSERWHGFRYRSPLGGEKRLEYAGPAWLRRNKGQERLEPGKGYRQPHWGVHSLLVDQQEAVLALFQYRTVDKPHSLLFMPTRCDPDLGGLYRPMPAERANTLLERLRGLIP